MKLIENPTFLLKYCLNVSLRHKRKNVIVTLSSRADVS